MSNYWEFLLKSVLNLTVLHGFYLLFLRKETYFNTNRTYLIITILISLIMPVISLPTSVVSTGNKVYSYLLASIEVGGGVVSKNGTASLGLLKILSIIYITGTLIFFLRFFISVFQLIIIIRKSMIIKKENYTMVYTGTSIAPFSFFNYIFVGSDYLNSMESKQILEHEMVHVSNRHTFDLLLCEAIIILQWFNPFAWYLKKSLQMVHEYIADKGVLLKGFDKASYSHLMLHHYFGVHMNQLATSFQNSIINLRIVMMTKNNSKRIKRLKYVLIIPIIAGLVLLQNCNEKETVSDQAKGDSGLTLDGDPVFNTVDEMPEYDVANEAGYMGVRKFMAQNIQYPEQAAEKGVQAKVYVQFVVDKNGIVKDVNSLRVDAEKVVGDEVVVVAYGTPSDDGVDYSEEIKMLEDEAVRVISSIGKWNKPGYKSGEAVNVAFTFPVKFVLQ